MGCCLLVVVWHWAVSLGGHISNIPNTHNTKQREGDRLVVKGPAVGAGGHQRGADFLLMAGEPLREPILASGPFVESDSREVSLELIWDSFG